MRGFASVAAAVLLAGTVHLVPVHAQSVTAGDLVVSKAWSRATPGGAKVAAGFLTIENKGSAPDKLVSASTPLADHAEIHEMKMANGVMSMREISGGLTIPAGQSVTLAPGGYHLMLMGPKQPFKQGEKVPLTLTFEKAGKVTVSLDVEGIAAKGPAGSGGMPGMKTDGHSDMPMKKM